MSGFSPEWLALREPADHRSRNTDVLAALRAAFARRDEMTIVDLGCGTGSNLRATAPWLGRKQHWLLVDHDPRLLTAARQRLIAWADAAETRNDTLKLKKEGSLLTVVFREADLAADLEDVLDKGGDLVTAAALFDITSVNSIVSP